ncbi:protein Mis18-beta isoform X1 [Cyclopterus lumpus]|uniref:protein Mis18-beta isoform X1 n=1 Tax=Cyclopterus lumpus TaxID=8103 RepID=UPI001486C4E3|nr:protein Mis18-beta isoform X1 [Cyclopterus lumpus]
MEFDESLLIQRAHALKMAREAEHKQRMTLHCEQCNTVLGDSLGICGELKGMDCIVCIRPPRLNPKHDSDQYFAACLPSGVTNDVVISDAMETGHKGEMASCIYSSLKCRGCRCDVGRIIHSAPSRLAAVRSMFLLHKANISCYILNRSSMVTSSSLAFDLKPLRESMNKMRKQFEAQLDQMSRIKSRLADGSVNSEFIK